MTYGISIKERKKPMPGSLHSLERRKLKRKKPTPGLLESFKTGVGRISRGGYEKSKKLDIKGGLEFLGEAFGGMQESKKTKKQKEKLDKYLIGYYHLQDEEWF